MPTVSGLNIANAVNGQGLPGNTPALTGDHAAISSANAWGSTSGNPTGTVTFDFQTTYALDGFSFWNFNGLQNTAGINGVTISTSTDGTTYNPLQNITGATTFNATTGAGNFAIGTSSGTIPVQSYTSAITNARYLRFNVTSNYGFPQAFGFSEAQFSGTPAAVPWETDALPMIGSTVFFACGVWIKRRRKNRQ